VNNPTVNVKLKVREAANMAIQNKTKRKRKETKQKNTKMRGVGGVRGK
jgi:hypothetical protein